MAQPTKKSSKKSKRAKSRPPGRISRLTKKAKEIIELCARRGFTDVEMSQVLGITEQTFNNWKVRHPDFFEALKDWKAQADEKVERALFERACGFTHPEAKAQWVGDENGGRWEYASLEKIYPPDTPAITLWLKNRQPEKWRDKIEHEHSGTLTIEDKLRELATDGGEK